MRSCHLAAVLSLPSVAACSPAPGRALCLAGQGHTNSVSLLGVLCLQDLTDAIEAGEAEQFTQVRRPGWLAGLAWRGA